MEVLHLPLETVGVSYAHYERALATLPWLGTSYFSCAYSLFASRRIGSSASASFQSARKYATGLAPTSISVKSQPHVSHFTPGSTCSLSGRGSGVRDHVVAQRQAPNPPRAARRPLPPAAR